MTHPSKLIVITLDGFAPSALSCYGSSWNQTPTIDALAAGGCLWDRCIAQNTDPLSILARWFGVSGTQTPLADADAKHWMDWWKRSGDIELLSDNQQVINLAAKSQFDQLYLIDAADSDHADSDHADLDHADSDDVPPNQDARVSGQVPCEEIESTQFAQLIAAAIERIHESDPWGAMWLHSDCLTKKWDAPRWLAPEEELLDELDEPIDESEFVAETLDDSADTGIFDSLPHTFNQVEPPQFALGPDEHPDLVATWMRTYGCQLRLIDELLGVLVAAVEGTRLNIIVAGTSGFSFGQNGWIGHQCGPLRSSQLHLPVIIDQFGPLRCPQLFDAADVPDLIGRIHDDNPDQVIGPDRWADQNWNRKESQAVSQDSSAEPNVVSRNGDGTVAVTTPNWFFVTTSECSELENAALDDAKLENPSHGQKDEWLFLKPDDIHDVNDVSRLRPEVVDQLRMLRS